MIPATVSTFFIYLFNTYSIQTIINLSIIIYQIEYKFLLNLKTYDLNANMTLLFNEKNT